ncbi:hypothetical protein T552_01983 [Pneumocystis carinii B80]|uniref:PXA domain-containing protein n=1 Tax=Pneumocystis carinii (strain B80) TaxID=1408658 RepID=A0A0W4ZIC3_PNEC8|nr:hypothetical protein T552_01983 [Pneumocystis carinii B80]KTW28123.1 hypothetical protein T552_01983 [Pneumocystis carinii B80]
MKEISEPHQPVSEGSNYGETKEDEDSYKALFSKLKENARSSLVYSRFRVFVKLSNIVSKIHPSILIICVFLLVIIGHILYIHIFWLIVGLILGVMYQIRTPYMELKGEEGINKKETYETLQIQEHLVNLSPMIATSLSLLFDNIMKEYVLHWYYPISKDMSFPRACRIFFDSFFLSLYRHIASRNSYDIMMMFFIQCSNTIIVALRELRSALAFSGDDHNINSLIAAYTAQNPNSALSRLLDRTLQRERFRFESENILKILGKKEDLNCLVLKTFVREMLTVQVFENIVETCSSSDFINEWIIYFYSTDKSRETDQEKEQEKSEAQLAMEEAMAEAAEMTRLLQDKSESQESPISGQSSPIAFNGIITPEKRDYFKNSNITCFASPMRSRASSPDGRYHFKAFSNFKSSSPDRSRLSICEHREPKISGTLPQDIFIDKDISNFSRESLYDAEISLSYVNSELSPKKIIKSKWSIQFLITIEPAGSQMSGWVIIKKYSDFETLHEVLRRLAVVSGLHSFNKELPYWKNISYEDLRVSLEIYLQKALKSKDLSDSHAMKSFLDKQSKCDSVNFSVKRKSWQQLRTVSDGVRDVIKAPAAGGKAIINALGAVGRKTFLDIPDNIFETEAENSLTDTLEESPVVNPENLLFNPSKDDRHIPSFRSSFQSHTEKKDFIKSHTTSPNILLDNPAFNLTSETCSEELMLDPDKNNDFNDEKRSSHEKTNSNTTKGLSNSDIQLFIDINFCILSEFYSLSPKTWSIRRSLLGILRSLLLRNGGTYVEIVKDAIEEKITNYFANEKWISDQINEIIMKIWPSNPDKIIRKDSEKLLNDAKRLFLNKTIPDTLKSLVGGSATKESLEIVFESLQEKEFMRGILSNILSDILQVIFQ